MGAGGGGAGWEVGRWVLYLNETSGGMAQKGQVEEDIMEHGGLPGGAGVLEGPFPLLHRPARLKPTHVS